VIEQIFGVMKSWFQILAYSCGYPIDTQAQLLPALAALHNFIVVNDADHLRTWENISNAIPEPDQAGYDLDDNVPFDLHGAVLPAEQHRADVWRDEMWESYSEYIAYCR
jgi:hypothetical protein